MASPSSAILRLDYSMNYAEFDLALNRKGFVGLKVAPSIPVSYQAAQFRRINAASVKRPVQDTTRAENGGYKPVDFDWDQDSYATEEHGLEHPIDDRNRKKYGDMINQELVAVQVIQDGLLTAYEQAVASFAQNTANVGTTYIAGKDTAGAGTNYPWTDKTNAVPEQDILQMITGIENACGVTPDTLVITSLMLRNLRQCQSIISQIKYSGLANPLLPATELVGILKEMTGLPKILVASGFTNTAGEGVSTPTFTRLWNSTKALICKTDSGMGTLESPVLRFANTIQWSEEAAANQADDELGLFFESYRDEKTRGEVMRGRTDYAIKAMHANTAGIITGC